MYSKTSVHAENAKVYPTSICLFSAINVVPANAAPTTKISYVLLDAFSLILWVFSSSITSLTPLLPNAIKTIPILNAIAGNDAFPLDTQYPYPTTAPIIAHIKAAYIANCFRSIFSPHNCYVFLTLC